jgi:hypothetical protein
MAKQVQCSKQVAQQLHQQCQRFLESQLPEDLRPAVLAAAGHCTQASTLHDDESNAQMHEDNVQQCTIGKGQGNSDAVSTLDLCAMMHSKQSE